MTGVVVMRIGSKGSNGADEDPEDVDVDEEDVKVDDDENEGT